MENGTLTIFTGTIIMITTMVGGGTLFMPGAVRNLGYINFIPVFVGFALVGFFTLYMISYVADKYAKRSIKGDDISYYNITAQYSKILAALIDISIIIQGCGACILYIIMIPKWIIKMINIESPTNLHRYGLIIGVAILVTFIALQKDLSALRPVQYVSVFSVAYLLTMCVYYSITLPSEFGTPPQKIIVENKMENSYAAIGSFVFAIGCHQNIVQVYSELKNRSMLSITIISATAITAGLLIYSTMGYFGYRLVGNSIENKNLLEFMLDPDSNFSKRLPDTKIDPHFFVKIGGYAFIVVMLCCFPMQMHPVRNSTFILLSLSPSIEQILNERLYFFRILITTTFCVLVTTIAMFTFENVSIVGIVVGFVAATAGCLIIYIIPGILYCLCSRKIGMMSLLAASVCLGGFGLSIYLIYNMVLDIMNGV